MVTDITYISTDKGNVFLLMLNDLLNNSIRGYCVSRNNNLRLLTDTLKEAVADIKTDDANPILLHNNQGFQYTSRPYERLTAKYGIALAPWRRTSSVI